MFLAFQDSLYSNYGFNLGTTWSWPSFKERAGIYVVYKDLDRERSLVCWFGTFQVHSEDSFVEGSRVDLGRFANLKDAKKSCENYCANLTKPGMRAPKINIMELSRAGQLGSEKIEEIVPSEADIAAFEADDAAEPEPELQLRPCRYCGESYASIVEVQFVKCSPDFAVECQVCHARGPVTSVKELAVRYFQEGIEFAHASDVLTKPKQRRKGRRRAGVSITMPTLGAEAAPRLIEI
jgi:hypothetical protein